jgi:hypothetical protein
MASAGNHSMRMETPPEDRGAAALEPIRPVMERRAASRSDRVMRPADATVGTHVLRSSPARHACAAWRPADIA